MQFSTKLSIPDKVRSACVAVGVFESRRLSEAATALDRAAHGQLREFLRTGDMNGKTGTTRLLYRVRGITAERVMLVGLGQESDFGEKQYRESVRAALNAIWNTGARDACLHLADLKVPERDPAWKARQIVLAATEVAYRFDRMKSKKAEAQPLTHVALGIASKRDASALELGIREGLAIGGGMELETIRDLNALATGGVMPDLTILLDLDPAEGIRRISDRTLDAFEKMDLDFHRRVREGYLEIARADKNRVVVLDADRAPDALHADVVRAVDDLLARRGGLHGA